MQAPSLFGSLDHFGSNEAAAAHYIEGLREIQPRGPYRLGGWSSGGVMAYEMARQLRALGESVELLLDTETDAERVIVPPGPLQVNR